MRTEQVEWFSEGVRLRGLLRSPDRVSGSRRVVVQGPGWLGLRDARLYERYHEALAAAGFTVLVFDYRGFGASDGDPTRLSLRAQVEDLRSAVSYLLTRDDVDADSIGVFGSGGTGGGNAVLHAATDDRVRAVVSQLPVADGADWLHRMRSEYEWLELLAAVETDRRERALSGKSRLVDPRNEIMVPTAERRATTVKRDVDGRVADLVELASVEDVLAYRPERAAARLRTPLLVIAVENDATTPTDHAIRVYEAARGPKELLLQRHTSHYAAYDTYWRVVTPRIVAWFDRYLGPAAVTARSAGLDTHPSRLEVTT